VGSRGPCWPRAPRASSRSSAIARCLPALAEIAAHYPGRLEVVEGDALKTDLRRTGNDAPAKIVANLPYNVGTQLLINWLAGVDPGHPFWTR
jgi:16S rRNA (adenine1518-N6/adenine1519-N6)-dimethyltransferase